MSKIGKREGLVYLTVGLWVLMGILGAFRESDLKDLAVYFGSLTAYVATYIWGESKRPSEKSGILEKGPSSRREMMIYVVVSLWAIAGATAIWFKSDLNDLAVYFVSLTGFVASWIAGEVFTPQDKIKK